MLTYLIITLSVTTLFGINSIILVHREVKKFLGFIEENEFEKAMEIYRNSLENRRYNPKVSYGLIKLYEYRQEWYLVVSQCQKILKENKFPPETNEISIRLKKIKANKVLQHYDDVVEDCYMILKLDSENFSANFEIGKRLFNLKNYQAARPYLERINKSDNKEILQILLDIEINEENYKMAIAYFEVLKKLFKNILPDDLIYKEILIYFYLKDYSEVIEVSRKISSDVALPMKVGVFIGISYVHVNNDEQALKFFGNYLKNFINDRSEYILDARYFYSDLLIEKGDFKNAYIQNSFIEQVDSDYRDVIKRKKILTQIEDHPIVKNILVKTNIEEIADEVTRFKFPDFSFVEDSIVFYGDDISNMKWFILDVNMGIDKHAYLFVSTHMKPYNSNDISRLFDTVREQISGAYQTLDFTFLTLYGMGIEAEKSLLQSFNKCHFYHEEDFIDFFKKKVLPI